MFSRRFQTGTKKQDAISGCQTGLLAYSLTHSLACPDTNLLAYSLSRLLLTERLVSGASASVCQSTSTTEATIRVSQPSL